MKKTLLAIFMAILLLLPNPALAQSNTLSQKLENYTEKVKSQLLKLDEEIKKAIDTGLIEKKQDILEITPEGVISRNDSSSEDAFVVNRWNVTEKAESEEETGLTKTVLLDFASALDQADFLINQENFKTDHCSKLVAGGYTLEAILNTLIMMFPGFPLIIIAALASDLFKIGITNYCSEYIN